MIEFSSFANNDRRQIGKKRGSMDTIIKNSRRYKNDKVQVKKQITGLSIDLNSQQKNPTVLSLNRNFTHRVQPKQNNLCDLRQEVEQLRMENQSLRQQIKTLKSNQSQSKYQISKLQRQISAQSQSYKKLQAQYELSEEKLKRYSQKIKQLFQNLISQKRKNSGLDANISKVRMVLSPSNTSINNFIDAKKFEIQGYRDYYNNSGIREKVEQMDRQNQRAEKDYHRLQKNGWNLQNQDESPTYHKFRGQARENFGMRC